MLFQPDAFNNDWYGWLTNQSGHILLGMLIAWAAGRAWVALAVALLFELAQWSTDYVDSVTDVAFTYAGAIFHLYAGNAIVWSFVAAMVIGATSRYSNGKH